VAVVVGQGSGGSSCGGWPPCQEGLGVWGLCLRHSAQGMRRCESPAGRGGTASMGYWA
jgi:hypothetical protein